MSYPTQIEAGTLVGAITKARIAEFVLTGAQYSGSESRTSVSTRYVLTTLFFKRSLCDLEANSCAS